MKHTPGPWRTANYDIDDGHGYWIQTDNETIARTAWETSLGEDFANAKLIAAAPDLLEACQKVVDTVDNLMCEGSGARALAKLLYIAVNDAIKKATE